jgi:hypothetical protein
LSLQAQLELHERLREHEAVKMIRLKNGLIKWSNANKEFAAKTNLLFSATHDIAQLIPDVANTTDIQVRFIYNFLGMVSVKNTGSFN